jgi:hypothetical protein
LLFLAIRVFSMLYGRDLFAVLVQDRKSEDCIVVVSDEILHRGPKEFEGCVGLKDYAIICLKIQPHVTQGHRIKRVAIRRGHTALIPTRSFRASGYSGYPSSKTDILLIGSHCAKIIVLVADEFFYTRPVCELNLTAPGSDARSTKRNLARSYINAARRTIKRAV